MYFILYVLSLPIVKHGGKGQGQNSRGLYYIGY